MARHLLNMIALVALLIMVTPVQSNPLSTAINWVQSVAVTLATYNCNPVKRLRGAHYYGVDNTSVPLRAPIADNLNLILYDRRLNSMINFTLSDPVSKIMTSPGFNVNLPMTILVHGYRVTLEDDSSQEIINALLWRGGTNVLFFKTGTFLNGRYDTASKNVLLMGKFLGSKLYEFINGGVSRSNIHLIGYSLGAHLAGVAGKTVRIKSGANIGRITGLDPAGPCFYSDVNSHKLWKTDADFVDIVHTDIGVLGTSDYLGHANFFPNNGRNQPKAVIVPSSHSRSWELYSESIYYPYNFPSVACLSWDIFLQGGCTNNHKAYMGYGATATAAGNYYLRTEGVSKFGIGESGARPSLLQLFLSFLSRLSG